MNVADKVMFSTFKCIVGVFLLIILSAIVLWYNNYSMTCLKYAESKIGM